MKDYQLSDPNNPLSNSHSGALEPEIVPEAKVPTASAVEAIERAQIDTAIATAKRYPRDLAQVKREMREMATLDQETAASCSYTIPRGGGNITGPSVRMAEIAFACYGNLDAGSRIVQMTDEIVTAQAVCHDLQKNNRLAIEFPRNVHPSRRPNQTEEQKQAALRDAKVLAALAASKIAFREVIFGVIPRSLVNPVWKEAQAVAVGRGRTFEEARSNAFAAFKELKVSKKEVCDYLGVAGEEAVQTTHLQLLHGLLVAINDSATSVEAEFGPRKKPGVPTKPDKARVPDEPAESDQVSGKAESATTADSPGDIPENDRRQVPEEPVTTPERPVTALEETSPFNESPPPASHKRTSRTAKPELKPEPEMNPIYGKVQKKMDVSGVTEEQLLFVLRQWGAIDQTVKEIAKVKVGPMLTADNDWQAVLSELAMNPDAPVHEPNPEG